MDHQWRPRAIQGQVCPTCSASHYPFCPPPPRYPFESHHSFQTPGFNPYAPPVGYAPNRNDGFGDPSLWHRNPDWDGRPHGQLPPLQYRPPLYEHGNPNGYVGEGDRNLKRSRIDDSNSASEDERRLKLIRDHGCALSKPSEEQSHGRPGFAGSHKQNNGFHSDVNHGELHKGEKDVFLRPQNGEFPPYQYNQTNNVDPQHHLPPPPQHHTDSWHGDPHLSKPLPQTYATQHPDHMRHEFPSQEGNQAQVGQHVYAVSQRGASNMNARGVCHPFPYHTNSGNIGPMEASRFFGGQPPLPSSPPLPFPSEPPMNPSSGMKTYFSPPKTHVSLFPVPVSSFAMAPSSYPPVPEPHSLPQPYFHNKSLPQSSTGFSLKEPSKHQLGDAQPFSLKQLSADKPKVIDASHLFRQPHRANRPDHIVIILRGLPGSGKSYLAKMLRDLEVEGGDDAPRIHSMDDYFMTEVEKKVEDNDAFKSSSSGIGKKPVMKKVMEYCYEPEMEEAYRSSMLKAFKKTVEEGSFTFIIVDDRNLRVADFAQFWATAKRSGYEVYILEAPYKDPAGCAARNVHGFTQDDIEKMAGQWEEAPSLYMQLDVKSLFHGDDLKESNIQEVDMDMEDEVLGDTLPAMQGREDEKVVESPVRDDACDDGSMKDGKRWNAKGKYPTEEVRDLGKSKWSEDYDEGDNDQNDNLKGNVNTLSGILHAYGKEGKSVHWGDQVGNTGFSIGAVRKASVLSLVIGPGAGYNLKSNPLPQEENLTTRNSVEPKKHSIFLEQIRAERESFKAVFDRRRQRIGGLDVEEE